jgi:hypothetical protein
MRPTVATVESTIKGGVALDLHPRTLIVGPNGAGKDAILASVALALTGIADDVMGREEVKDEGMVATLGDATGVRAVVRLTSGTLCEYETTRKPDGGAKKAVTRNGYPNAYPLRAVRAALTAGPDKARAFLLTQAARTITIADVLRALHAGTEDDYTAAAAEALGTTPVDRLLSVHASLKKRASDAKGAADALEESIRRMGDSLGAEPLSADVDAARAAVDTAQDMARIAVDARGARHLQAAALEAVEDYQRAQASAAQARAAVDATATVAVDRIGSLTAMREAARWHAEREASSCALCGSHPPAGAATWDASGARITEALAVWATRAESARVAEGAEARAVALRATAATMIGRFEAAGGATLADRVIEGAEEAAATAHARLHALIAARQSWATVRGFRADQARSVDVARAAEALRASTTDAIVTLLDGAATAFAARVQQYLPPSDTFALRLRDGDRDVCRFGFLRDGTLHAALSGAEWARCLLAIGAAVSEGTSEDHPLVLVPPERAYDPATLAAVMVALSDAPGQVLLASPIMPAFVPVGWHVVTLGDVAAYAPVAPAPADTDTDTDAGKPKRARRTKAEMAAARAAEAAGATPPAPTLDPAPTATPDAAPDATPGPWFDAGMLIDAPTTIVARTPDQTTYAPTESDNEVAAFFARVRGIAEAK